VTPLRPHQEEARRAVEDILPCLSLPSIVVQACTGAGKTAIADALRPDRVIAPGIDLVRQLRGRIRGAEVHTIQSLSAMLDRGEELPPAKRLVIDEGRCVAAPKWCRVPERYLARGTQLVILDATPATPDGKGLGQWASAIYQVSSMRALIDRGHLVPFRILTSEGIGERPVDVWRRHLNGRRTLTFCRDKKHAAQTVAEYNAEGIPADMISDSTPEAKRRELLGWTNDDGVWHIGALASGKIWVLVCAQILRQGIDIPEVEGIQLVRRMDSFSLFMQAVGRGSRPCERIGKRDCVVVDMVGELTDKHGLPTDHKIWSLGESAIRDADSLSLPVPCPTVGCRTYGRGERCAFCGAPLPAPGSPEAKRETLVRIVRQLLNEGVYPYNALSDAKKRYHRAYDVAPPAQFVLDVLHEFNVRATDTAPPMPIAPRDSV
jgi:superfamily II DNA or RNA helicase